jgi:hypothetical protein
MSHTIDYCFALPCPAVGGEGGVSHRKRGWSQDASTSVVPRDFSPSVLLIGRVVVVDKLEKIKVNKCKIRKGAVE